MSDHRAERRALIAAIVQHIADLVGGPVINGAIYFYCRGHAAVGRGPCAVIAPPRLEVLCPAIDDRRRGELRWVGRAFHMEGEAWRMVWPPSVVFAPRGEHSVKPVEFYEIIERCYPELGKIELFCRTPRQGWAAWGNQVEAAK